MKFLLALFVLIVSGTETSSMYLLTYGKVFLNFTKDADGLLNFEKLTNALSQEYQKMRALKGRVA